MGESKPWELTAFMHVRTRERGELGDKANVLVGVGTRLGATPCFGVRVDPTFIHGTAIARSCSERGIQSLWQRSLGHWQSLVCSAQRIGNALAVGYGTVRHTTQWKEVY
jgi:hypothetical protein